MQGTMVFMVMVMIMVIVTVFVRSHIGLADQALRSPSSALLDYHSSIEQSSRSENAHCDLCGAYDST